MFCPEKAGTIRTDTESSRFYDDFGAELGQPPPGRINERGRLFRP